MVTKKSLEIPPFLVMDVLEKALEMERRGGHIIHLEVGEPDFETPTCVREACAKALREGKYSGPVIVEAFGSALKAETTCIAPYLAECVGETGTKEDIMPLITVLEKNELENTRNACVRALKKITGVDFGDDVKSWRDYYDTIVEGGAE